MHRFKYLMPIGAAVGLLLAAGLGAQQEHPQKEHPQKEHPAAQPITTAELEKAIRSYIEETAKKSGGMFPVKDDVLHKTWQLTLVKIHSDKLTQLNDKTYFACVDFRADDGTLVDVDFFLEEKSGKLKPTSTTVHKVNGVARYMYQQKGDFWERVEVEGAEHPKKEHPAKEHPKNP
jgi:hypothetical protein